MFFFFFFQAEDGIRDLYVTGVQTCALPICGTGPLTGYAMIADIPDGNGTQAGGKAEYQIKRSSVGLAASHFEDAGAAQRSLDAVGLLASTLPGHSFRLTGEAAWRRFEGGQGAGYALGVERNTT